MFTASGTGSRPGLCLRSERWRRRLTVCLIGCLISAFMVLPDYLLAGTLAVNTDNASHSVVAGSNPVEDKGGQALREQPALNRMKAERDRYKWKFIVCFPMPVDVMPVSAEKRRLGGAGLISTLDSLTVNDLLGPN